MGAEREDPEALPARGGTDPGLGPGSGASAEHTPPPVDFDALHAALGDPLCLDDDLQEAPDDLLEGLDPANASARKAPRGGESSGQASAAYSSARPHTIPPTRAPAEDPNVPAVIVATDDTVRSAPPQMTLPTAAASELGGPSSLGDTVRIRLPGDNPEMRGAYPSSGSHLNAAVAYPVTPQPCHVQPRAHAHNMTMRMPERPLNPRRVRLRTPTIALRPRGPSAKQKIIAFVAMLLLVTACGMAVIIWRQPAWLGVVAGASLATKTTEPTPSALVASPSGVAAAARATNVAPPTSTSASPVSAGATAAATASTSPSGAAVTTSAQLPSLQSPPPPAVTPVKKPPKPLPPAVRAPLNGLRE